jgi:hypothetical protein
MHRWLPLFLLACHSPSSIAPDATPATDASVPIEAPADTWTWVPIAGTKCVHGAETGIAVNLHPGATHVVFFLQGGGSCTNCWGATEDAKVGTPTHYDATTFAAEHDVGNDGTPGMLVIDRTSSVNPFTDASYVFVPYCTGDAHGGTATRTETGGDGLPHDDTFWGALDLDLILQRVVPTFPGVSRVYLAGTSAGAVGTTFSYRQVRTAFGVRTDIINDSGPAIVPATEPGAEEAAAAALWGVTPASDCGDCTSLLGFHHYNRALDPDSKYALLSHAYDPVIAANNYGEPTDNPHYLDDFHAALLAFVAGLGPNAHALIIANTPATAHHVVMDRPHATATAGAWLKLLADDSPSWDDLTQPD